MPRADGEIWETEHLATQWGFDVSALGWRDTGMEMGLEEAHALRMPSKAVLLDYAQRSFAAVTRLITQLDDDILAVRFASELESGTPVIESAVVTWLSHNERHLGMMECLRGLLGFVGPARSAWSNNGPGSGCGDRSNLLDRSPREAA
jgi:hypothetical protein